MSLTLREQHRLRCLLQTIASRRIFGLKKDEEQETEENCVTRSFVICTLNQIQFNKFEKYEMGKAYRTQRREKECMECFGGKAIRKETAMKK